MDSASSSTPHIHNKNPMASPPEALPYDRFVSPALTATRYSSSEPMVGVQKHSAQKLDNSPPALGPPKNMASLLSPPPSPFPRGVQASSEPAVGMSDPELFSVPNSPALASQRPLFNDEEQFHDLISKRTASTTDSKLKPTVQEYQVFVSAAFELCRRDPGRWLEREKRYMANVPTQWSTLQRMPKVPVSTGTITSTAVRALAPARKPIPTSSPVKIQRPPRTPKVPVRPHGSFEAFARDARITSPASTAVRTRQPATREDTDFESIPDLCPPLSSLNENSKFRVEWKGTPLDLSNDPHRHLLHPAEIHLASVLRLSCASYLTSKRRIFKEKIERARQGMEFRKTDSQKACKIDVNKASKLWSAYEKIGWFDAKYITPYLQ